MTKKLKKVLALLLTLSMVMSMVTVGAMAADDCGFGNHDWQYVTTKEATCTEWGEKDSYCTKCGKEQPGIVPIKLTPLGHDWEFVSCAKKLDGALCTAGHNDNMKCARCGLEEERFNASGHSHNLVITKDAVDLGNIGNYDTNLSHTVKCTECMYVGTEFHSFAEATCTGPEACACGHVKLNSEPLGHDWSAEWSKDETNHWHDCIRTDCEEKQDVAVHTWNEGEVTKESTCFEKGIKTYTCTECGQIKTEDIVMIPHSWDDGVVTTEPTETEKGVKTFTCTIKGCGATRTEDIPATGSTTEPECEHTNTKAVDNGNGTHKIICDAEGCGHVVTESEAHTFESSVCVKCGAKEPCKHETTTAVDTKDGLTHKYVCNVCGEQVGNDENHNLVNGFCTECGAEAVARVIKANPLSRAAVTANEFTTLQAAVNDAKDGDTVEVMKDIKLSDTVTVDQKVTLDLGTYGITRGTGNVTPALITVTGGKLTIAGSGEIYSKNYSSEGKTKAGIGIDVTGGELAVESGTVNGYYGIRATGGTVNVTGGTVKGANRGISLSRGASVTIDGTARVEGATCGVAVIGLVDTTSGTLPEDMTSFTKLTVNGGTIIGSTYYGISGNGSDDGTIIEINGGTITGNYTAIYHPQVGDMTITGGEITGPNGVQYSGAGNLTIIGGKITATLPFTEAPQKPATQNDGTVSDGAALSIVSRGGGWQNEGEVMNVTVTGGEFISENNSAVAVYRIAKIDGKWQVGNDTGLDSYLSSLTITGGKFTGNVEKGVLDIDAPAMSGEVLKITGGYYNQDIDDIAGKTPEEKINYVFDTTYASHPVSTYEGYFHVHQPGTPEDWSYDDDGHWKTCSGHNDCLVTVSEKADHVWDAGVVTTQPTYDAEGVRTFTCDTCGHTRTEPIPMLDRPTTPSITYYTLTINYVDGEGNAVADTYTRDLREGRSYSVTSPAVEGMTPDQATVSGVLNGNTTITVTYAEDVEEPNTPTTESPDPTESPEESEDLGENDTPLTETPETSEPPVEPTETSEPTEPQNPDETEDLSENDTPLADVPQTGDFLWVWLTLALLSAAGLVWVSLTEKKGKRVA